MLDRPNSTYQIDKKYKNIEDEGKGSHQYYVKGNAKATRKFWLALLFLMVAILVIVYILGMIHGRTYGQEWMSLIQWLFSYTPGKIKNA